MQYKLEQIGKHKNLDIPFPMYEEMEKWVSNKMPYPNYSIIPYKEENNNDPNCKKYIAMPN